MSAKRSKSQSTTSADSDKSLRAKMSKHFSGSDVSQTQLVALRKFVSKSMRSGILRTLKCSEVQLRRYADSDISLSDLPERTREVLATMSAKPAYAKPWPKKSAAMLYELHMSRKRASRKPQTAKSTNEQQTS